MNNKLIIALLVNLAKKQLMMDEFIHKNKNTKFSDTFSKRIIALFTEIAEFINEERSFKYWSNKPSSSKKIILEEYIDCLHFILSLGNDINFKWSAYNFNVLKSDNINELILTTYINLSSFSQESSISNFTKFLDSFLSMAIVQKFNCNDLLISYQIKNKINYKRQNENY